MEFFLIVPLAYLYFRLDERGRPAALLADPSFVPAAAAALGIGMVLAGMAHLANPEFYAAILPAWLPQKAWLTWSSGWAQVACGAAMMQPAARKAAQVAIFFLLAATLPHSVHFASLFEFSGIWSEFPWAWSRLVCHLGWLAWTLWCVLPLDAAEEPAMLSDEPAFRWSPERSAWTA